MNQAMIVRMLCLCWLAGSAVRVVAAERPNILFIFADDQSYKTLSCYPEAAPWVKTPQIDAIASRGIRFERAYLGAWCMPSRASCLTGLLQHAVPTMRMEGTYPGSVYDPVRCRFFPSVFREQGYHTAQIGKWHTGTDTGYGRDWDCQMVWNRPGKPENAGNYYHGQVVTINGVDQTPAGYSTDNYTDWANDYIRGQNRDPEKPWFLWLCYGAIHGPTTPADRHKGSLKGNEVSLPDDIFGPWPGKPAYLETTAAWRQGEDGQAYRKNKKIDAATNFNNNKPGQRYANWVQQVNECAMAVDEGVGKLMEALRETGQLDNTLVIYTADQGFALGEHGMNQKVAPYDAAVASPLILSLPGKIPTGQVCRHPVNAPDLVRYLCDFAGVTIPWAMHGRDIRPLLENPDRTDWNHPMIMTHTGRIYGDDTFPLPGAADKAMNEVSDVPWYVLLREGRFKYIRYFIPGEKTEELYDLEADSEELRNLAGEAPLREHLVKLRTTAVAELRRTGAAFVDALPPVGTEK